MLATIACLTAHCFFENFDQQALILHAKPFNRSHTGDNVTSEIEEMMKHFAIKKYNIHSIMHEN